MPFFRYQAFNAAGQSLEGTLQANSATEAAQALSRQGLRVTDVTDARTAAAPMAPPPGMPSLRQQERPSPPQPLHVGTVKGRDLGPPRRTKRGSEKKLMLIFSQLAAYFRSGLQPQRAFLDLASRESVGEYRESLQLIANNTVEGGKMSDLMELYPDLYPPHVVGIVRSGETGGFLPEAMESISAQVEASYKFKRWANMLAVALVATTLLVILVDLTLRAAGDSWTKQEETGGTSPGMGTFLSMIGSNLLWPVGPFFLGAGILFAVFLYFWTSMPFRERRHKMVLHTPTVGKRARKESLGLFAWSLSMLSKGGASPSEAWSLAVSSMPNQYMRQQMEEANVVPGDQRKLSELLALTKNLPDEFLPMVQTGEITGDVPGALMHMSRTSQDEFKAQDQASKVRMGCWIFMVSAIGGLIGLMIYFGRFIPDMMHRILGE